MSLYFLNNEEIFPSDEEKISNNEEKFSKYELSELSKEKIIELSNTPFKYVGLDNFELKDFFLLAKSFGNRKLNWLKLCISDSQDIDNTFLFYLTQLNLESEVDLSENPQISAVGYSHLQKTGWHTVNLEGNNFMNPYCLEKLGKAKKLRNVNLRNTGIDSENLKFINKTTWTHVDLGFNGINNYQAFEDLEDTKWKSVDLTANGIDDPNICTSLIKTKWNRIILDNNDIDVEGFSILSHAKNWLTVSLKNCDIDDEICFYLAHAKWQTLDLSGNEYIEDEGKKLMSESRIPNIIGLGEKVRTKAKENFFLKFWNPLFKTIFARKFIKEYPNIIYAYAF